MNRKGYLLIEIILASAIAFGIAIFIFELTIKVKNRNDDLFVETQMATDQAIISNRFMTFAMAEKEDFNCDNIEYNQNGIYYTTSDGNRELIDIINDYGVLGTFDSTNCVNQHGKIKIVVPLEVIQQKGKDYNAYVNYRYRIGDYSIPQMSLVVKGGTSWEKTNSATITISDNIGLKGGQYTIKYGWSSATNVDCSMLNGSHTFNVLDGTKELSFETTVSGKTGNGNFYVCNADDNPLIDMEGNQAIYNEPPLAPLSAQMLLDSDKPTIDLGNFSGNSAATNKLIIPLNIGDVGSGITTATGSETYIKNNIVLTIGGTAITNFKVEKKSGTLYNLEVETNVTSGTATIHIDQNKILDWAGNGNTLTDIPVDLTANDLFKVTYKGGNCTELSGSMSPSTVILGLKFTPKNNEFTCKGHVFNGWKDSKGNNYPIEEMTWTNNENVELIAQWIINKVNIRINMNGGSLAATHGSMVSNNGNLIIYNGNEVVHAINYGGSLGSNGLINYNNSEYVNIEKTGYVAKSGAIYNTKSDGTGTSYNQTTAYKASDFCDVSINSCNITLYVNWQPRTYTVTYHGNGGSGGTVTEPFTENVTYDQYFVTKKNWYTKSGYTFDGWNEAANGSGVAWKLTSAGVYENGNGANPWKWTYTKNIDLYAQWKEKVDEEAPKASLSSTNTLKSTKQTATLSCTDDMGVVGYYFGTTSPNDSTTYSTVTSATSWSKTQDITSSGTYYLACKDAKGNISATKKLIIRKYVVKNMLQNASGSSYTSTNFSEASSYTYYIKDGATIALDSVYTIPGHSRAGRFKGYSSGVASATAASLSTTAPKISADTTYSMWFTRNVIYFRYQVQSDENFAVGSGNTTEYTWDTDSNKYVRRKTVSSGTTIIDLNSIRWNSSGSLNLYNNATTGWFSIRKKEHTTQHYLKSGAEWACVSGCASGVSTFSQAEQTFTNTDTQICNTSSDDCIVVLKANWDKDLKAPTGKMGVSVSGTTITFTLSDLKDEGVGLSGTIGWSVSTSSSCNASTSFTNGSATVTTQNVNGTSTYYGCAKIQDKVGNTTYISSPSAFQLLNNSGAVTGYANTLGAAFSSVAANGTIKVLYNNTSNGGANSKTVTFNSNGKTVTIPSTSLITNSGNLTITGSGVLKSGGSNKKVYLISNTGTLNVSGGTIHGATTYGINSSGMFNISGGKIIGTYYPEKYTGYVVNLSGGKANITGGLLTTGNHLDTVINQTGGTVAMSGGSITNGGYITSCIIQGGGVFNMSGGLVLDTFKGYSVNKNGSIDNAVITVFERGGVFNLTGGTINSDVFGFRVDSGTLNVKSGTYTITGSPYARFVYEVGGVVNISNSTITANDSVLYIDSGKANVISGTFITNGPKRTASLSRSISISTLLVVSGTLTIGNNDSSFNVNNPRVIQKGVTSGSVQYYGIRRQGGTLRWYDGDVFARGSSTYVYGGTPTLASGYTVKKGSNTTYNTDGYRGYLSK